VNNATEHLAQSLVLQYMKNHVWQKVIQNQVVHVIVAVEQVIITQIVMPQRIKMDTTFESNKN